jgi:hypothetical protein
MKTAESVRTIVPMVAVLDSQMILRLFNNTVSTAEVI